MTGGVDDLAALRDRLITRVDEATAVLNEARRELAELPPVGVTFRLSNALTASELQVLRLLSEGRSTDEIAAELFISKSTVRGHVQTIMTKLGVHTRLDAVRVALERYLL